EVDCRQGGAMGVGKKYRGKMERVLQKYINDQLTGYTSYHRERVFITHSGTDEARIALMKELVEQTGLFDEVIVTRAGCTISAHCGPHTMGVLFIAE
ncbi:MAG: DegV family protein, partial [Clostridiales bacterium]|nr:DegV family protein [Clostridiales bacterium]